MTQLDPICLGLGGSYGYSGDDLTSPRAAVLRGEVPYLPLGTAQPDSVLELRIHGVGGAPASDNLETPDTLQEAGDSTAGFYRPWYPGGRPAATDVRREAYCWGKLNYRSASRALWLLLISFMIVNVAYWTLPATAPGNAGAARNATSRALLRVLALSFTAAFVGTSITLLVDLVAWQAPARGALPSWLHAYAQLGTGPRMAIALFGVLAVLGVLVVLSVRTARSYEKKWDAGLGAPDNSAWALSASKFWRGERTVVRQRYCHITVGAAGVMFAAAMPHSSALGLRVVAVSVAAGLALAAVCAVASPWSDRIRTAGGAEAASDLVGRWVTVVAVGLAAVLAASRFWWRPDDPAHALPGSQPLQTGIVFAEFAVLLLLAIVLWMQRPWRQPDVMGKGMAAALLGTLAAMIATIFGAALTLTVANLLGSPKVTDCAGLPSCPPDALYMPSTVYAGGIGMLATIVSTLLFGVWAYRWMRHRRALLAADDGPGSVRARYPRPGGSDSVHTVAEIWARSQLTDLAAGALTAIAVPTAIAVLADQSWLAVTGNPGARLLQSLSSLGGTFWPSCAQRC
ncbi:MAG: hypothetical protein ACR2KJ_16760 [Jatrophihabitans sp.]